MIRLTAISASRGGRQVLNDITFDAPPGLLTLVLGRSGSGKSTLLRLLNRLSAFDRGEIQFDGHPIASFDIYALRRSIGFVPQNLGLFPHRRVRDQLHLAGAPPGTEAAKLNAVDLPSHYADRFPRELSGGEQQRVAIARALAADPKVLLLDEPFSALDPILRRDLEQLVKATGKTTLLVSHDATGALRITDRVLFLEAGRIRHWGDAASYATSEDEAVTRYREATR